MKKVAILGSTGSIGTQTLEVIRSNSAKLRVWSLVAYSNEQKLNSQANEFAPHFTALVSKDGENSLIEAVKGADVAVVATRGITALPAVVYCLKHGIDVALANKEVLVTAGSIVMPLVSRKARILPVDSEHCAISQCLAGKKPDEIAKIILTASGGACYDVTDLTTVTPEIALKHPNWNMGAKITVDSATMVNKAFEVIEASHLFSVPTDKIQVVVHRQSVVHSAVEFVDGSVLMQAAVPDMRLPIQIALLGGHFPSDFKRLNFDEKTSLTFENPDVLRFPCVTFGHDLSHRYPLSATVFNAANDVCVENFLAGKMQFTDFYPTLSKVVDEFEPQYKGTPLTVQNVLDCDKTVKQFTQKLFERCDV